MSGVWLADAKVIGFGKIDLVHDFLSEPVKPIDDEREVRSLFCFSPQRELTMSIQLTKHQMEHLWVVYHNLRRKLASCPSKRVYHNAFQHRKARVREKNRKRAQRLIERMMNQ